MSWQRPNVGSRVNREVHARFWERAEVKLLCATRHSLGGLIELLYARTYSSDVRGIVFVDALSPTLPIQLGALWPLYLKANNPPMQDQPFPSMRQPESEQVDIEASIDQVRQAPPLAPIPLAVVTWTEPFQLQPGSLPAGITSESLAAIDT